MGADRFKRYLATKGPYQSPYILLSILIIPTVGLRDHENDVRSSIDNCHGERRVVIEKRLRRPSLSILKSSQG